MWDLIEVATMIEGIGPDKWAVSPRAVRSAARIYQGELARVREIKSKRAKGRASSSYGERVRAGRG